MTKEIGVNPLRAGSAEVEKEHRGDGKRFDVVYYSG
jgi:hypothetical protein